MPFNFKVTNHTTAPLATHLFIDCLSLAFCFTSKILTWRHMLSTWPSISKVEKPLWSGCLQQPSTYHVFPSAEEGSICCLWSGCRCCAYMESFFVTLSSKVPQSSGKYCHCRSAMFVFLTSASVSLLLFLVLFICDSEVVSITFIEIVQGHVWIDPNACWFDSPF